MTLPEQLMIPTRDGTRLACHVRWGQSPGPHPVVVEANPYRGGDFTAAADIVRHQRFADAGITSVRVDLRGSGNSEGIPADEYVESEQDDLCDTIAWLAAQRWCNGSVGMMGLSWGGFAALQVASRRPSALKAIIAVCATADRYENDIHFGGGTVLGEWAVSWPVTMAAYGARPPDPTTFVSHRGQSWREAWHERLGGLPDLAHAWFSHQRRDAYWQHGSVATDYSAIDCPAFLVGGWSDSYSTSLFRLAAELPRETRLLIGPWGHQYPDEGVPGPAIDFAGEAIEWWKRWLLAESPTGVRSDGNEASGAATGATSRRSRQIWLCDPGPPRATYPLRPGQWVSADRPSTVSWTAPLDGPTPIATAQSVGAEAGNWCEFGPRADLPPAQSADDERSLCLDGEPLEAELAIVGEIHVDLEVETDQPVALVAVRLVDLAPDGTATLISRGVRNLTHRESHDHPSAVPQHTPLAITIPLRAAGYRVPPGHRLRLALSTTYWPWALPSPVPATVTVLQPPVVRMPIVAVTPAVDDQADGHPRAPRDKPQLAVSVRTPPRGERDREAPLGEAHRRFDLGRIRLPGGAEVGEFGSVRTRIVDDDPTSAAVDATHGTVLAHEGWEARTDAAGSLRVTETHIEIAIEVTATENDDIIGHQRWRHSIERDLL